MTYGIIYKTTGPDGGETPGGPGTPGGVRGKPRIVRGKGEGMTAKQAIKARCFDCSGRECGFTDCALKGLTQKEGRCDRTEAIRRYCQWCMSGHPVNQCASPDCAICQYRANASGNIKVSFLPGNYPEK